MLHHWGVDLVEAWVLAAIAGHRIGGLEETRGDAVVTCGTVRETELEVGEPAGCALHPVFVGETPSEGDRWEGAPTMSFAELGATVGTYGDGEQILLHHGVVDTTEEREHVVVGLDV